MYPNQPPVYTTRHYNYNPTGQPSYVPSHSSAYDGVHQPPSYPYYTNNSQPQANYYGSNYPTPTTVTYVNDRSNYGQAQTNSYVPPSPNRYPPNNNNYPRSTSLGPPNHRQGQSGGGIEKTNNMSNENPFYDPGRSSYEPMNSSRSSVSITAQAKSGGSVNNTLNLSDESPFHSVYGGYHYPAQIDPAKRITTQNTAVTRSTDNKSLNLSEENPFFSIYGGYHYPSQIDPSKRITEMPKAAGPLMPTNNMSNDNPFNPYQAPPARHQMRPMNDGPPPVRHQSRPMNDGPPPLSYRPMPVQHPAENYYDPPAPPPPVRRTQSPPAVRNQPAKPSGPLDKTSLNMSPDNPFAEAYGNYHYPSSEEIKAQKRANNRINEQRAFNESRPVGPAASNPMTEYPEPEKKDIISGKGQTKFTRFDVNF